MKAHMKTNACTAAIMLASFLTQYSGGATAKGLSDPRTNLMETRDTVQVTQQNTNSPSVEDLVNRLGTQKSYEGGQRIIEALVTAGPSAVEPVLARLTMTNANWQTVYAASEVLGRIGDPRAIEPLIQVLGKQPTADGAIRHALVSFGKKDLDPLLNHLLDSDTGKKAKDELVQALGEVGNSRAVPLLVRSLQPSSTPTLAPWYVTDALVKIGKPAVSNLVESLGSKDESVRCRSAECLGKIGDSAATEPLISCLTDPSFVVRMNAAEALGRLRDKRAMSALVAALTTDVSREVRMYAATALGHIGDQSAVSGLVQTVTSESAGWSYTDGTHLNAITALGMIPGARTTEALRPLLHNNEATIREAAARALDKQGFRPTCPEDTILLAIARKDVSTLTREGKKATEFLMECLRSGDPDLRMRATQFMGEIADPTTVDALIAVLQRPDSLVPVGRPKHGLTINGEDADALTRRLAAESLGKIGDPRAIPALAASLPDWDMNEQLGIALARLNWQPSTKRDKAYFLICQRDKRGLDAEWGEIWPILIEDVKSGMPKRVENTLCTVISTAKEEMMPQLVETLEEAGSKEIAEAYLNSGNKTLRQAAENWAKRNGYYISIGGRQKANWGGWKN